MNMRLVAHGETGDWYEVTGPGGEPLGYWQQPHHRPWRMPPLRELPPAEQLAAAQRYALAMYKGGSRNIGPARDGFGAQR